MGHTFVEKVLAHKAGLDGVVPGQIIAKADAAGTTLSLGQVEALQVHNEPFECYDVTLASGGRISVTVGHAFMIQGGLWAAVQNLRSGWELQSQNGTVEITNIVKRKDAQTGIHCLKGSMHQS